VNEQLRCDWKLAGAPSGAVMRGRYRYLLWRTLPDGQGTAVWLMLNPSTADAYDLDPTIRRCMGFSRAWGYRRVEVINLFALRSSDPDKLLADPDPVGPENDIWIENAALRAEVLIAAWGAHKAAPRRGRDVAGLLASADIPMNCLGRTQQGFPKHPLYTKGDRRPEAWDALMAMWPEEGS
jgi:hypothetical protein